MPLDLRSAFSYCIHANFVVKLVAGMGFQMRISSLVADDVGNVAGMRVESLVRLVQRCVAIFPFRFSRNEVQIMV